jgi:hypothetical protein
MTPSDLIRGVSARRAFTLTVLLSATVAVLSGAPASASAAEPCQNEAIREQQRSTFLPDCRAYEMVSPPDKNGGDVMPNAGRTRASEAGNAVDFASLSAFGDAVGTGLAVDYISVRDATPGTNGWATHSITPPMQPLTLFNASFAGDDPLYVGDFSPDLSKGVFRTISPLTDAPNVQNVLNLYVRTDLLTPGAGTYRLASDCTVCTSPLPALPYMLNPPALAGASADFSHLIFESTTALTADAIPDAGNLYEWDNGTLRLASVLPDSACGTPPCAVPNATAGQGALATYYTSHTISADGSRVFFTDPASGNLYMRVDHASTVQLNASERTNPEPLSGARFEDATPDGSRIFFTTGDALTDDAHIGQVNLYMYNVQADPQGHHLTLLSTDQEPADDAASSDDIKGVIGASTDGDYVYFIGGTGQLVPGASLIPGLDKVYVWHQGTLSYIGAIANGLSEQFNTNPGWSISPKQTYVTPDGRRMLFITVTGSGLTGYDHGSCPGNGTRGQCRELYVYSAESGTVQCVSCDPGGSPGTADATTYIRTSSGGSASAGTWHLPRAMSDDGHLVFFSTAEALVPEDVNGRVDAYEYDTQTGTVHLLSSGRDPSGSYFMDASATGNDVFIVTRQRLVGWDTDGNYDLYDVRVNGGLPEPVAASDCTGDACQSHAPTASPAGSVGGSEGGSGRPGNLPAASTQTGSVSPKPKAHSCRHGYVRRKVNGRKRCVKTKARHASTRTAVANGRGIR